MSLAQAEHVPVPSNAALCVQNVLDSKLNATQNRCDVLNALLCNHKLTNICICHSDWFVYTHSTCSYGSSCIAACKKWLVSVYNIIVPRQFHYKFLFEKNLVLQTLNTFDINRNGEPICVYMSN